MPRDRKYKTKNTGYKPGNVTDIVKEIKYGSKPGYRTGYHKETGLTSESHNKVKKLRKKILGK